MNNAIYNFPYFICKIHKRKTQKIRFKEVISDKEVPNSYEEMHYKEISDSYTFLMNNIKSPICDSFFIKTYFLLTNKRISRNKASHLVSIYYQYKDSDVVELLAFLLEEINKEIKYKKMEYGLLLINYFFKRADDEEIELCLSMFKTIKKMFLSKENIISTLLMLKRSLAYKEQYPIIQLSKEEIMDFFYCNKQVLKTKFLIKRLFLFGSFANETYHNQSDLDLLVLFDGNITNNEKIILCKKIKAFIEAELKIHADVINFEYAIPSMDFMSLNNILTIY